VPIKKTKEEKMKNLLSKLILFASATALVMIAASAFALNYDPTQNYGRIGRLYPSGSGITYFRLVGGKNAMNPLYGYYWIPASCANCNEMRELVRLAAEQRLIVQARTSPTLSADGTAQVHYLVIDYETGEPIPSPWNIAIPYPPKDM
jgi:hypothetical protein